MKITLLSLMLAFVVAPCFATERTITVSGTSTISIPVDTFELKIFLETKSSELADSASKNNASFDKLKSTIDNLKLKNMNIKVSQYNHGKHYKKVDKEQVQDGFYTSRSLIISFSGAQAYTQCTYALAAFEDISIQSTNMSSAKYLETRSTARKEALTTAKKKAEEMAEALNMVIRNPINIEEEGSRTYHDSNDVRVIYGSSDFANLNVKESVTVTFVMQPEINSNQ